MNAELLRGLAGLREAIKDWGDNMRSETMADLLAHVDRIEQSLSVAQGQGFVMVPREPTTEILIALAEASLGILTESVTLVEGYSNILAAAHAQPDGVE